MALILKIKLIDILKTGAGFILGVAISHFGGQLYDQANVKAEAKAQAIREAKIDETLKNLNNLYLY